MKNRIFVGAVIASVLGQIAGLLFLLLSTAVSLKLDNPDGATALLSLVAILIGSVICGLVARKLSLGAIGGVASGLAFGLIIMLISIIGGGATENFFIKLVLCLSPAAISMVIGLVTPKKKSSRKGASARMKSMYKRV